MNIDTVINALEKLNLNFTINHTNNYSELRIHRNNVLCACCILFNAETREIFDIAYLMNDDED